MAIYSKSGYKRNVQQMSGGGTATASYFGFAGSPFATRAANIGHVKVDIVHRTWYGDTAWKAFRAANGFLPTRQLTMRRIAGAQSPVTYDVIQWTDGPIYCRTPNACWNVGPNVFVLWPNQSTAGTNHSATKTAMNRCLVKARDLKTSVPIFLAEGRKTVQMIAEAAKKLAEAYRQFRRGNFRRVAELLGIPTPRGNANNWLQYQYGWSPLIKDLTGLAELAAQQIELGGRKPRFKVFTKVQETGTAYKTGGNNNDGFGGFGGYTESFTSNTAPEFIGRAWLFLEVEYSDAALASQLGFGGFFDIASVAWELVPFSFVFDWFVNVGETLEAMSALKGLKVLDGGCSLEQRSKTRKWTTRQYYSNYSIQYSKGPEWNGSDLYFQRVAWNGDPSGRLTVQLWDALGARRIISAAALGLQR